MLTRQHLILTEQFIGPPDLGNGGYVVGHMAGALAGGDVIGAGAIEVTLRAPLPLGVPFGYQFDDAGGVALMSGDDVMATAKRAELDITVPDPAPAEAVRRAQSTSHSLKMGFHSTLGERLGVHPVCFCCGAERGDGDGLRVFPVAVEGAGCVTALWTPHEGFAGEGGMIGPEIIGAAIDCPGAFAFLENGERAGLLGRMSVEFLKLLRAGEETRIVGWRIETDGRKMIAGTAIFDATGDLVAKAKQVWFGFPGA